MPQPSQTGLRSGPAVDGIDVGLAWRRRSPRVERFGVSRVLAYGCSEDEPHVRDGNTSRIRSYETSRIRFHEHGNPGWTNWFSYRRSSPYLLNTITRIVKSAETYVRKLCGEIDTRCGCGFGPRPSHGDLSPPPSAPGEYAAVPGNAG
ncbi:hypothetical protein PMIN01_04708 [Paraphaeosphaeria minitans]|uniref:Uncharacterized protein n=1 Tax=Paraphaeosphaeria minitans TaxID=565426 RepID=A0A9P6KSQ3_9PLEO|nr:hypothetical protein PMIN01_04708 [Paraphaeosphaeria minitans]